MLDSNISIEEKVAASKYVKEGKYWVNKLSGNLVKTGFPYDYAKTKNTNEISMKSVEFSLKGDLFARLMKVCQGYDHTLHMLLVSSVVILLNKYTGNKDIILGVPIYKQDVEVEFVNTVLALRNYVEDNMTFKEILFGVRQTIVEANENQNYPLETLLYHLNIPFDENDFPLFDVMVLLESIHDKKYIQHIHPNMIFSFHRGGGELEGRVEFNSSLYEPSSIRRITAHFNILLQEVLFHVDLRLARINILSAEEQGQQLVDFNHTAAAYPADQTIHHLIQQQVSRTPGNIALAGQIPNKKGTRELAPLPINVTYKELDQKSNQLANYLINEKHIQPGDEVGILMDNSPELVITILGILKAGAAYVPMDPVLPEERIKLIINDANLGLVISLKKHIRILNRLQWECSSFHTFLCMDSQDVHWEEEVEKSQLMDRKLWDYVAETAVDEITAGGWNTSFTGQPFSKQEMDEYGDNILKKLLPLLQKDTRVLEIGCASGISMYRIAPRVGFYYGTDLSPRMIEKNKERVNRENHKNITLSCLPAHQIDTIAERNFDLIVLNSVIQSFHGHNYLRKVIRKAIDLLGEQGHLFVGDIMDHDLKSALIEDLLEFKRTNRDKTLQTKTDFSIELFVARGFFNDLSIDMPQISGLELSRKIYTIENELTKYRYDALITVDKTGQARQKTGIKQKYQEDLRVLTRYGTGNVDTGVTPGHPAYVIYTSGTTGTPRGVMIEHRSLVNYAWWAVKTYIKDRTTPVAVPLYSSISFDLTVTSIYLPLLTGGTIVIYSSEDHRFPVQQIVKDDRVDILKATPSHLRLLQQEMTGSDLKLRTFIVGGEELECGLAQDIYLRFSRRVDIYNEYGPTEATVGCMIYKYDYDMDRGRSVSIGLPVDNVCIYILDNCLNPVPINGVGEIYIGGDALARGYVNHPELTAEKFCLRRPGALFEKTAPGPRKNFLFHSPSPHLPIYRTGDLARRLPDGNIQFLGRVDEQIKIRGYRIELKEIENRLLTHSDVKEAVVLSKETSPAGSSHGAIDRALCAYIVLEKETDVSELIVYLSMHLPDYMIPAYFVPLEKIPLTVNGKLDHKALPEPKVTVEEEYTPPRDDTEKKLAEIWATVLKIEKNNIGIDTNFFQLGGHSLLAIILISLINKEFHVEFPLNRVFSEPTIREFADFIKTAKKKIYQEVKPVCKKEYYPLSSAQKRLFFLEQLEGIGTSYNVTYVCHIKGNLDKESFEPAVKGLITRHETLRTSFILVDNEPVQQVHQVVDVNIEIEYTGAEFRGRDGDSAGGRRRLRGLTGEMEKIIQDFIRPFDLSKAPLLRVRIVESTAEESLIIFDMHHIISDGTSMGILTEEFMSLFSREELSPLKIQYKDFSCWQNDLFKKGKIKEQEDYWMGLLPDAQDIPRLNLPLDYPRPDIFTFAGDHYGFFLEHEDSSRLKELCAQNGGTLFMNLLAALNVLLYKYTNQEDIIIGSSISGRPHYDLQRIIGMFVNELIVRNYPKGEKSYAEFLEEVKRTCVKAYENQDVQFEELVDRLNLERDPSRNPIFDVCVSVGNFDRPQKKEKTGGIAPVNYDNKTSKFDITLFANESSDKIYLRLEYCTSLFKRETIEKLAAHFVNIIRQVAKKTGKLIAEIDLLNPAEKKQWLYEFNKTGTSYPEDKTVFQLFTHQVDKTPDHIAVISPLSEGTGGLAPMPGLIHITYLELKRKANQIANYLYREKGITPESRVGILMDHSPDLIVVILGVLAAGGAYVPIEPSAPEQRTRSIISDAGVGIIISQKKYIRDLNRLQWECETFHTFLCVDSTDIYGEREIEKNELMDEKLWEYVGETATDDITGGGWVTSTTGQPFTREEMDEYGDNVLKKLMPLLHKNMRVLEIGCASGITMYRIAPKVGFYYGTDLSNVIIQKNRKQVKEEGLQNITLAALPAHLVDTLPERNFELVIINSVIQSFHGHNYLRQVTGKIVDLLCDRGYLFIGDIMDQELKKNLTAEMIHFKQTHTNKEQTVNTKTDWSSELFVSRSFFEDLTMEIPGIAGVTFSKKIHTIKNELTKFRYDCLMEIDKTVDKKPKNRTKHKYQEDIRILEKYQSHDETPPHHACPGYAAYIIYTSGTTGIPKGVMIEHRSLVNYVWWGKKQYIGDCAGDYIVPLYTPLSFDLTVTSIYLPLITGNRLAIYGSDREENRFPILDIINRGPVDVVKTTPSHLKLLRDEITGKNHRVKKFIVGGEELETTLARDILRGFPGKLEIYNEYGPTEATVGCMIYRFAPQHDTRKGVPIGIPIENTKIYLLDKDLNPVPGQAAGEICIGGKALARGYVNLPELTTEKFLFYRSYPTYKSYISKRLYKTGDLARRLPDGNLEFLGRLDQQVKIRGYRIEINEIESQMLKHEKVKDTVILLRKRRKEPAEQEWAINGDEYLCCYWVPSLPGISLDTSEIKDHLTGSLPDYMIPSYFVRLDEIPLTPNGKVNRKVLPEPGISEVKEDYTPPANELEKKLVEIWSDVLGIKKDIIGIHDNFFHLGGHSLRATILVSRIHKELNVKIPLAEIFRITTIEGLAQYVKNLEKDLYEDIKPVEKREYYPQSSAQKRLFFLEQFEDIGTSYNMPYIFKIRGEINAPQYEKTLRLLIERHETLRTCFTIIHKEPVQIVHDRVDFAMEMIEPPGKDSIIDTRLIPDMIKAFVRPFDLSKAPLLRAGLMRISREEHLLLFDMHHIIADGTSITILSDDFMRLSMGNRLTPLKVRYKDFSRWQNDLFAAGKIKKQEEYWLNMYSHMDSVPILNLPTDYPRKKVFNFEGATYHFMLDAAETSAFKELADENGATLYMNLMAVFNVLLHKYSGQDDIVVGTGIAGRPHSDLENIIGMFVNTLAIRNYPQGEKRYLDFLQEVKDYCIKAFENQDMQFEELVERISPGRTSVKNPIFSVELNVQNFERPGPRRQKIEKTRDNPNRPDSPFTQYGYENITSKFDLILFATEIGEKIDFVLEYATTLFKPTTIEKMAQRYVQIIKQVVEKKTVKIKEIKISHDLLEARAPEISAELQL